jgi:hypothetical protein
MRGAEEVCGDRRDQNVFGDAAHCKFSSVKSAILSCCGWHFFLELNLQICLCESIYCG